jgi:hypothetical protein
MSDAPEQICLLPDDDWSWVDGNPPYEENAIQYTRTDLAQAAVAAALERAAKVAKDGGNCFAWQVEKKILSLIEPTGRAALDAVVAERTKELEAKLAVADSKEIYMTQGGKDE